LRITLKRKKNKQQQIFSINSNNSPNTRARKIKKGWTKYTTEKAKRVSSKLNHKFDRYKAELNLKPLTGLPFNINKPQENNSPYVPNSPREFMPSSPLYVPPHSSNNNTSSINSPNNNESTNTSSINSMNTILSTNSRNTFRKKLKKVQVINLRK
jgi:outer membrane receptor for monomeric catechols